MDSSAQPTNPQERRRHPRIAVDMRANLYDAVESTGKEIVSGRAVNISRCGMMLKIDFEAPLGSLHVMAVSYGDFESICLAQVVWKDRRDEFTVYGLDIKRWSYMDPALERLFESHGKTPPAPPSPERPTPPARLAASLFARALSLVG